jgi:hypothetical protein
MPTSEILNPTREIKLRSGAKVSVKELSWLDALNFIKLLGDKTAAIGKALFNDEAAVAAAKSGDRSMITERLLAQLQNVVVSTEELCAFLFNKAAGLTPQDIADLSFTDAVKILRAALELTLNDEVMLEGNAVAARVMTLFPKTTPAAKETTMAPIPGSPAPASAVSYDGRERMQPLPTPSHSAASTLKSGSPATG